jgi:hypothetical protein
MLEPIPFAGFVEIPDELTDKEIVEIWRNQEITNNEICDAIVFARTILRKAQEK